jgi:hypothetical protein
MKLVGVVIVASVLVTALLFFRSDEERRAVGREPVISGRLDTPSSLDEPLRAASERNLLPAPAAASGGEESLRDRLASYWGTRWPEQEAKMLAAGLDLDQPYEFTPWEAAAPELEAHLTLSDSARNGQVQGLLEWPETPDRDALARSLSIRLPEEKVAGIVQLAEPYNERIRGLAHEWTDMLQAHLYDAWSSGRFQKAPFTSVGLEQEQGFHVQALGGRGWTATIVLVEDDCPDMMLVRAEIRALREERLAAILRYVRE